MDPQQNGQMPERPAEQANQNQPDFYSYGQQNGITTPQPNPVKFSALFIVVVISLILVVVIALIGFSGVKLESLITNKGINTAQPSGSTGREPVEAQDESSLLPYPTGISPDEITFTSHDKQRLYDIQMLGFTMITFFINNDNRYPADAAEASTIQRTSSYIDPETKKQYVFTDDHPARGEVQYKLGAGCTDKNRRIVPMDNNGLWALAMLLDDGTIICKSNTFSD